MPNLSIIKFLMNFRINIILALLFVNGIMFAQHRPDSMNIASHQADSLKKKVIQFTGVVLTADSLKSVSFAHIMVKNTGRGTNADYLGFFSFAAYTGEELIFSAVGYKTSHYKIPDTLSSDKYTMYQMMQTDTFFLKETVIYPWPNIAALEYAILYSDIPETDYDRAMKNLEVEKLKEMSLNMGNDGSMNFRNQIQGVINKNYYSGQYMPIKLTDPFAWAQFIKAWKEGKFKRQDD